MEVNERASSQPNPAGSGEPHAPLQILVSSKSHESLGKRNESIWSDERKLTTIDTIQIEALGSFSDQISSFLSGMQVPPTLYAGDKVAPIKPIDVFAATAEKLGVKSKRINFTIGDYPYIDISDDGESLIVCLSKFDITNPRMGLLGTLAFETRTLLINRGVFRMNKAAREDIARQNEGHVFGRATHGEAVGYQIPPEHQRAYYRGVRYDALRDIAEKGSFIGGNSDSLLAHLKPTVWAYTDPGMAESFGGKGKGIVFKLKKRAVDNDFTAEQGWQQWTVNEIMIQPKIEDTNSFTVPINEYVEQILVFDDEGHRQALELFPHFPVVYLKSKEEGHQYLVDNGEITNEELEQYYDNPARIGEYIGHVEENPIMSLCQIESDASYEVCTKKMETKIAELSTQIFGIFGLEDPSKRRYMTTSISLNDLIEAIRTKSFFRLPPEVKKILDANPEAMNQMSHYYKQVHGIHNMLKSFNSYSALRESAQRFKAKNLTI